MPADVVVIGNAGVDTNVYLPGADVDWGREANFSTNLDHVGQAGGYAARGYAQLGYRTAFVGSLGDDPTGRMVREAFSRDGIAQLIVHDPAGTARSVNIMGSDGSRKNFYDARSHMTLPAPDATDLLSGARLAHVNLANWARHLLGPARDAGAVVACDLQDVADPADPYRADFIDGAHILFASAANGHSPDSLARALLSRNPRALVVLGLGAEGCAVADSHGLTRYPAPPSDLPVVDTNGAGDSLAVGFLSAHVLDGLGIEGSVERGQRAARWCCAQRASTEHLFRLP